MHAKDLLSPKALKTPAHGNENRKRRALFALALACCLLAPAPLAAQQARTRRLAIPGTGDSQLLLRDLAQAFMNGHPGVVVDIPDSIGSSGGRKAVQEGQATLARVANSSPRKEARHGLSYQALAFTLVVFAVHPSVSGVRDITPDQALGIYAGTIRNWSELGGGQGKIYPISREPGDSSLTVISKAIPGFKEVGAGVGKMFYTTPEALDALRNHKGTIAYGPLAMFASGGTRVLSLSGIRPDPSDPDSNRYPLKLPLGFAWKTRPQALERSFLEFTRTREAAVIIRRHACIPAGDRR